MRRRDFLAAAAGLAACGGRHGHGFNGYAFVANAAGKSIAAVSLNRFRLVREIPMNVAPGQVLAIPGEERVAALTPSDGGLIEIEGRPEFVVRRRGRIGAPANGMRLARDGKSLWVLCPEHRLLAQWDLTRWQISGRVRLPDIPADFDLNENTVEACVSCAGAHSICVVDLRNGKVNQFPAGGAEPGLIRYRYDGAVLLAANRSSRSLSLFDKSSGRLMTELPLGMKPQNFCFTDDKGGQLFVTGTGMDAVAIVSPFQTEVAETVLAGSAPAGMAVSVGSRYLFVTNPGSGDVTVIDVPSRRVLARIAVGDGPRTVTVTPDNGYALALNEVSGEMAVIRISTIAEATLITKRAKTAPLFTLIPVGQQPVSVAVSAVG